MNSSTFNSFLEEESEDIALGSGYQNKLINVFCNDRTGFSESIVDILQSRYFDGHQKILVDYCVKYFNDRGTVIRFDTLRDRIGFGEKGLIKEQLLGLVDNIENLQIEDLEEVKESSREFFKRRSFRDAIIKAATKWEKGESLESISKDFEDALKAGEPKETGHDYINDVNKRLSKDFRTPIPVMEGLDEKIGGGLSPGELAIVIAPPGGGKSMKLVKYASTALLEGKKVLYYTLELSEEVVGQRFDACINDIKLKNVWDYPEYITESLQDVASNGGSLIIKEFLEGGVTINTIKSHLKTLELEGFIPDVIFIDYLGLMKPLGAYAEKRHALTDIAEGLRSVANNYRVPVWSAHQTNRTAIGEDRISSNHIGESLGIMATADLVLGVGRPDELKEVNKAMLSIIKNRNGEDGVYIMLNFDTSRVFIEISNETDNVDITSSSTSEEPDLDAIMGITQNSS